MVKKQAIGFLLVLGLLGVGCSHTGSFTKRSLHPNGLQRSAKSFLQGKGRGSLPQFDIPIEVNDRVLAWIDFFQGVNHERFSRYLQRSGRYVEWMRGLLKEEGVPQDLVYLALIESGFSDHAYSKAKAMGPWQFIRSTGAHYGLGKNAWLDERRDPEKATRAAAQYLKKLYGDFGDWYLAMAAYNAGEGKMSQAIQRSGSRDFWEISAPGARYLKPETKDYVPKFIAAAMIAKNPARFGFNDVEYHPPFASDTVKVEGPLDLSVAAELASVDIEEMKRLNPELNSLITPPHPYSLRVPKGNQLQFEEAYHNLPPEKRIAMISYKVKRGESVGSLAKRYGISPKAILAANGLSGKTRRLKSGTFILIPKGATALALAKADEGETQYYKVKRHDTIQSIASKFGMSVTQLKKENHLKNNHVALGRRLKIATPSGGGVTLLAYNKKSKRVHQNGVEWLIQQQQKSDTEPTFDAATDPGEATDATEVVTPSKRSSSVDDAPEINKEASALPADVEEQDLSETSPKVQTQPQPQVEKPVIRKGKVSKKKSATQTSVSIKPLKKTYVVKRGDSLAKIAKRNGVSVANLKIWNRIAHGNTLQPGKKLVIATSQE